MRSAPLSLLLLTPLFLACGDKDGGGGSDSGPGDGGDGDSGTTGVEPGPCEGDRTIDGSASYEALVDEACTSISGSLTVSGVPIIELGLLTSIGGDLTADDTGGLSRLLLPSLESVGGAVTLSGTVLEDVELPLLATTGSAVRLELAEDLAEVALGLTTVGGNLSIRGGVTNVDLDALTTVEQLRVDGTASPPALSLSSAVQVGALGNDSDPMVLSRLVAPDLAVVGGSMGVALTGGSLELASLEQIWGACVIEGVAGGAAGASLPALFDVGAQVELRGSFDGTAAIAIPSLQNTGGDVEITATGLASVDLAGLETTGAAFRVEGTDVLSSLDASALGQVGGNLQFIDNASLPTCDAVDIVNQVTAAGGVGGSTTVSGNLADGCSL
ncbi:MAG: hypothetical protein H6742_03115 [Alphaproteobacteria bacterium]|nr:hypothetical protein [Alphaproteobacteria bacterium]